MGSEEVTIAADELQNIPSDVDGNGSEDGYSSDENVSLNKGFKVGVSPFCDILYIAKLTHFS